MTSDQPVPPAPKVQQLPPPGPAPPSSSPRPAAASVTPAAPGSAPGGPGSAPAPPPTEQAVMKLTRGHSCVLCQQRKVRCDKLKPCANCKKAQVECRVVPPQPPRRRKKKPHERDLIERIRRYEALLSQAGVNFDPIAHELVASSKPSDGGDDGVGELEQDLGGLKASPSSTADHMSPDNTGHDRCVHDLMSCLLCQMILTLR